MRELFTMADLTRMLIEGGFIHSNKIAAAFLHFDRKDFIREEDMRWAYEDNPIPIGYHSFISQPSTVAMMLELLGLKEGQEILEVGTGSGWETCLLSYCVGPKGRITSMEISPKLMEVAESNIKRYGLKNVRLVTGDGTKGYTQNAPYDRIIFTAAASEMPKDVLTQLKKDGRLLVPIGTGPVQAMTLIEKTKKGLSQTDHGWFSFQPLESQG